jgi:membrane protein
VRQPDSQQHQEREPKARLVGPHIALLALLWDAVIACFFHRVPRMAAALAYFALISLAPLLLLVIAITGQFMGADAAQNELFEQLALFVGPTGAEALRTLVASVGSSASTLSTTLIGVFGLLIGGSALFHNLKDSINTIWEVVPRPDRGIWNFLIARSLAIVMAVCIGIVALVGLMLSVELDALAPLLGLLLPGTPGSYLLRGLQILLALLATMLVVTLSYHLLPDTRVSWRDSLVGAALTCLLLVASQALIGAYLRSVHLGSAYSAMGAVVIVLVWVYYAAVLFLYGAAFTRVYANRYGERIVPMAHALPLTVGDRAIQGLLATADILAAERRSAEGDSEQS